MARKTPKNALSTRTVIIWFIIMAVFISELLIYTWSRVQCIKFGYEISNENNKNRNLINLQNNLKVELARLKSPERLAKIAKNQLGLKTPTPKQIIIIP
ncbi:MAG: cell division protein FtsL [Desulfobacteraceae bacterium]|nr:cell division protein FtsL [Desulfobacteraceae bacterium]MBC2719320.1 cell division protein FtsL [Desulfobacteraceae bacterium]